MKLFYFTTALLIALFGLSQVNGYINCAKHVVVKHGDTCYDIYGYDERHNNDYYVRFKDLLLMNSSIDCDKLRTGQKICVKFSGNIETHIYKTPKAMSCKEIAKALGNTVQIVQNMNIDLDCSKKVKAGTSIQYRTEGYNINFAKSKEYPIYRKN
ncbi:hypothetical protein PIROE2DRAFT_63706 [Piromyces sp. E2]|nr:hypothetical protein PIROE2DRAFT_63706 [Piromyces sp. E2]|eukprot:OUM59532.1 hypothetical protein PIROE2DRAFT_63706 [Piromyces sp. E2]